MKYILILALSIQCAFAQETITINEDLQLAPIAENVYVHISHTQIDGFGRVASNGLIFVDSGEAIIADTPANNELTTALLDWLIDENITIKAVYVNHFHSDCLGGLDVVHNRNIPSYGYSLTRELALKGNVIAPQNTFDGLLEFKIGKEKVVAQYFGQGHAPDNSTLWIPSKKILFGGCMIKSLGAGKGNLSDANLDEWSPTVDKVKRFYPDVRIVVPGHGPHGGAALLDYTIQMFEPKAKGG
ncbi:MAG: subclass B1 metallo-beta-lactamase [Cyclobacteriaceae bacterium]